MGQEVSNCVCVERKTASDPEESRAALHKLAQEQSQNVLQTALSHQMFRIKETMRAEQQRTACNSPRDIKIAAKSSLSIPLAINDEPSKAVSTKASARDLLEYRTPEDFVMIRKDKNYLRCLRETLRVLPNDDDSQDCEGVTCYEFTCPLTGLPMLCRQIKFSADSGLRKAAKREIALLKRLDHPGVPKIYEIVYTEKSMLVMSERLQGQLLKQWMAQWRPLSQDIDRLNAGIFNSGSDSSFVELSQTQVQLAERQVELRQLEVKLIEVLYQVLSAVAYLSNGEEAKLSAKIHPEAIFVANRGQQIQIKLLNVMSSEPQRKPATGRQPIARSASQRRNSLSKTTEQSVGEFAFYLFSLNNAEFQADGQTPDFDQSSVWSHYRNSHPIQFLIRNLLRQNPKKPFTVHHALKLICPLTQQQQTADAFKMPKPLGIELSSCNLLRRGIFHLMAYRVLPQRQTERLVDLYQAIEKANEASELHGHQQLSEFMASYLLENLADSELTESLRATYQLMKKDRYSVSALTLQELYDGIRNSAPATNEDTDFITELKSLISGAKRELAFKTTTPDTIPFAVFAKICLSRD